MRELRDYQIAALANLKAAVAAGKRRPVLAAATGSGKTAIGAAVVAGALAKGNRVIFCVPAISLIDQTVAALREDGITEVGVLQADHPETDWRKPVQVASIQTLSRRRAFRERWRQERGRIVVIIDECHVLFKFYREWMAAWDDVTFIGLSATPWTKGLGKLFDDLIIVETTETLISRGYLSPFEAYGPSHPYLARIRIVAGDYHEGELAAAMNKPALVADTVATWLAKGQNRPTFVFAVNRAHARNLQAQFEEFSAPTAYIDAFTEMPERNAIRDKFHAGEIKVVCSVGCLTTGVDWDVRCICLCRPTRSEMLFVQMIGRGLRTAPGKDKLLILDHSDTHVRLGEITSILLDKLDDGKERKKGDSIEMVKHFPKPCPECSLLRPPGSQGKCPNCGYLALPKEGVRVFDGDLIRIGSTPEKSSVMSKANFYLQLRGYAITAGYKPGFAKIKFKEKFGEWPSRSWDSLTVEAPSAAVTAWVRGQQREFLKQRKAEIPTAPELVEIARARIPEPTEGMQWYDKF